MLPGRDEKGERSKSVCLPARAARTMGMCSLDARSWGKPSALPLKKEKRFAHPSGSSLCHPHIGSATRLAGTPLVLPPRARKIYRDFYQCGRCSVHGRTSDRPASLKKLAARKVVGSLIGRTPDPFEWKRGQADKIAQALTDGAAC